MDQNQLVKKTRESHNLRNKLGIFLILLCGFLFLIFAGSGQVSASQSLYTKISESVRTPSGQTEINSSAIPVSSSEIAEPTHTATVTGNIPGLIPADAILFLEDRQFRCKEIKDLPDYYHWDCVREGETAIIEVGIFTKSLERVDLIDTNVLQDGDPADAVAIEAFKMISEMPFPNIGWGNVHTWLENTLPTIELTGDIRTKTIDGIQYRVYGSEKNRSLEIGLLDE